MWGFYLWKLKELRCKNGRSGRLERWWCIGIWKSSKIDCTPKSFTSSPTIFHELLKTSALCGSVNGGRHICHNQASAASRHFKKQKRLRWWVFCISKYPRYFSTVIPSEIELGLPWRHFAWALILIMPTTSGIALHLSSVVVKLG